MQPRLKGLLRSLQEISDIPETDPGEWLASAEDSVDFLKKLVQSDRLVLFASLPRVLIHAALAPLDKLDPPDRNDLMTDFLRTDAAWMIQHASGGGKPDRVYLSSPLERHGNTLASGEKLIFRRPFAGSDRRPIELSQKLVHALDLHFIPERNAYCRLDDDGDLEDVISIVDQAGRKWGEGITVVSILAADFTEYMRLAGMGMVIFFDFTRVDHGTFHGWTNHCHFQHQKPDLFYHGAVMSRHASYINGRMIVRPIITLEEMVQARKEARDPASKQYAVFKAINLKDRKRIEISCNPNGLSNYFQPDSPLPLEMSPVFFKAEVLHRYKADQTKYELTDRAINCRGTWYLQTYDINDAGQVHTYLRYLAYLPYKEQLYWQSFNEWPKAPISRRAFTTDFQGEFYSEYDPLNSVKAKLRWLDANPPIWWHPRGDKLANAVHYPATNASDEWANEILALDQLIVEGFAVKELRAIAKGLGRTVLSEWQSLKLLEECLAGTGVPRDEARSGLSGLRLLHDTRTAVRGHAAPSKRATLEKEAIAMFGSFRGHFSNLVAEADAAMEIVVRALAGSTPH